MLERCQLPLQIAISSVSVGFTNGNLTPNASPTIMIYLDGCFWIGDGDRFIFHISLQCWWFQTKNAPGVKKNVATYDRGNEGKGDARVKGEKQMVVQHDCGAGLQRTNSRWMLYLQPWSCYFEMKTEAVLTPQTHKPPLFFAGVCGRLRAGREYSHRTCVACHRGNSLSRRLLLVLRNVLSFSHTINYCRTNTRLIASFSQPEQWGETIPPLFHLLFL